MSLLQRAWPDGVDDREVEIFRSLPLRRREKVIARLGALMDIEEARQAAPGAKVDMKARAADAGLTVDGLFALRRKWEADRSVASLAPYLERAERQPTQRADDDPIVIAAKMLITARPARPDSVMASELRQRFGASIPNMIRLVRRLRREEAADPARIAKVFGRGLLIDVCAVDRVNGDGSMEPIAAAIVVERAVGLVLGLAVTSVDGDMVDAQRRAVAAAIARISDDRLDVDDNMAAVELTIGEGPDADAAFASAEALKPEVDLRVNSRGPRRYGQRIVSLLGKRMNRIWWRPRSSAPGSTPSESDAGQVTSLEDAMVLLSAEAREHNKAIEQTLAEGGVGPGWGLSDGAMASALRLVMTVLDGQTATDTGSAPPSV